MVLWYRYYFVTTQAFSGIATPLLVWYFGKSIKNEVNSKKIDMYNKIFLLYREFIETWEKDMIKKGYYTYSDNNITPINERIEENKNDFEELFKKHNNLAEKYIENLMSSIRQYGDGEDIKKIYLLLTL